MIPVRIHPQAFLVVANHVVSTVVTFTVAPSSTAGGLIHYLCEASNGTELQAEVGQVLFYCLNNNTNIALINRSGRQPMVTSGTIESTWSITNTDPSVVSVVVDSSLLTIDGYPRLTMLIQNLGRQEMLIQ